MKMLPIPPIKYKTKKNLHYNIPPSTHIHKRPLFGKKKIPNKMFRNIIGEMELNG